MEARSRPSSKKRDEMNFIFPLDAFSWKAMELTASRRNIQLSMSSISQSAATRTPARGSSPCSR
jgi:hypothetical protein